MRKFLVFALLAVMSQVARADDSPTIAKDFVQFKAYTVSEYKKSYDVWSWLPLMKYRVNGPIPSGSQLYVEVTVPGVAPWKFDCQTEQVQKDRWWNTNCGGRDIGEEKGSTYVGPVSFAIKMRNELQGTNITLFNGKTKVTKVHSNEHGPKAINKWVYYVDHDWTLPIGYVFLDGSKSGWDLPELHFVFWIRGFQNDPIQPHLFFEGKEIGKQFMDDGTEVGAPGCSVEESLDLSRSPADETPQKAMWSRVGCTYYNVRGWDRKKEKSSGPFKPPHLLSDNPGNYELKTLWKGHLSRSIKFKVAPDGKFDNGIATANKLGSDRVIVPVTILGDQDGVWDKLAWKTGAFYGNPLTGFPPAP